MDIKHFLRRYSWTVAAAIAVMGTVLLIVAQCVQKRANDVEPEPESEPLTMFDIEYERYEMVEGEIESGQPMGKVFERFGIGARGTYLIEQASKDSFDLRKVQAGRKYVAFLEPDTLAAAGAGANDSVTPPPRLAHFVYEKNLTDYFVISLTTPDSIVVRNGSKPVQIERRRAEAEIESSMWNAIVGNGYPIALASQLEDIFGWSVDFFGIQKGDSFEVIYDQPMIDSTELNYVSQVWGARFNHGGKEYYAIPFIQDGKVAYWDENGNSLKKQFLRAPLKYSRISSTFTRARRHPITRVVRPHLAVDFAAPSGTPVSAVADGVVTRRFWDSRGGGNALFIKHARGYVTRYLHLRGFASGIAVGTRVSQGQVVGYVGSTGASTGPHLDYQISLNGKPINPLGIPQEPGVPIKEGNRKAFAVVRAKVMGELDGTLLVNDRLTRLDSIVIPDVPLAPVNPAPVDTTKNVIDG
ncbi:MAG: peptidoglycan DD-metalloendopeptidase family protein [Alistipes sp.]|jgi:murein DD-endopeptidase MepM/ murein hydrolase activator NlpD|nr:peptidoglycan DD-metalloendopeptidase family protein [Alistipes sp.]